jgi:hypothetical protein
MIIALAGRRIDASDTRGPRFPFKNIEKVKDRIKNFFISCKATALVCSAACGSDLLALDIAGELKLQRRIILPFPPEVFKMKSVNDCQGDWKLLFDRICKEESKNENLIVLDYKENDQNAYEKTNIEILNTAEGLMQSPVNDTKKIIALVVWDGKSKRHGDITGHFLQAAKNRNIDIEEIRTL